MRLYEPHDIDRFLRVQDFVSSGRLVTCAQASAGKRRGTAGKNIGNAHLQRAFSGAAALCLRNNPPGQKYLVRWEKKHDKGQALTILAPKLARAVYDLLTRHTALDIAMFYGPTRAEQVSLRPHWTPRGMSRHRACSPSWLMASWNAKVCPSALYPYA